MKSKWMVALLVVLVGLGAYGGTVLATPSVGQGTTTLAKATVGDDLDLRGHQVLTTAGPNGQTHSDGVWQAWIKTHGASDLYVIDNKFAVGGTSGWHSHLGPSLIFVVAGTITNYTSDDPTCTPHAYSAGESFVDPGGDDEHILRNEGSVPAETIAVQFLPQGASRKIDEPSPGNCPF